MIFKPLLSHPSDLLEKTSFFLSDERISADDFILSLIDDLSTIEKTIRPLLLDDAIK